MKKKSLKLGFCVLLMVLLFGLTGCGKQEVKEENNLNENNEQAQTQEVKNEIVINKADESKEIVYSGDEYETDFYANVPDETFHYTYKYPVINIASSDVESVNAEIKEKFGFTEEDKEMLQFMELEMMSYQYYRNENVLSVIPIKGGNDSTWSASYNIDLGTNQKMTNTDLLENKNIDLEAVKEKLKNFAESRMEADLEEMKKLMPDGYDWCEQYVADWKKELGEKLQTLDNVYLNEDGDVCIRCDFLTFGGQEYCNKLMEINASKMSGVVEIKYEEEK